MSYLNAKYILWLLKYFVYLLKKYLLFRNFSNLLMKLFMILQLISLEALGNTTENTINFRSKVSLFVSLKIIFHKIIVLKCL